MFVLMACLVYMRFWRAVIGEAIGTLFFVLILGGVVCNLKQKDKLDVFIYSVTYAVTSLSMTWSMREVSGGHLNPAVTTAMIVCRRIHIGRAGLYFLAQCTGGMTGAGLLYAITRDTSVGATRVDPRLDIAQAFGIETMGTFLYVFSYFAAIDRNRIDGHSGGTPVIIAAALTAACMFTVSKYIPIYFISMLLVLI